MKITVAKTAGFCFGVDRAVQLVYRLLEEGRQVYTLGPIIHNPQMVAELAARGVKIAEEPGEVPLGGTLVIRSHGVTPAVLDRIRALGLDYALSLIHIWSWNASWRKPWNCSGWRNRTAKR